jgi:hypothetical protein
MTIDVEKGTVRGSETIRVSVTGPTSFIVIHASEEVKITKALLALTPDPTRAPSANWMNE